MVEAIGSHISPMVVILCARIHMFNTFPFLSRVVSSPLAVSIHHIDESSGKVAVGLFAGMQRVIPEVRVRVRSSNTVCAVCGAVVDIASHSRVGTVQVLRGVVVHIGDLFLKVSFPEKQKT